MGVDAYHTYQTSRTTFSAALSAAPATILPRNTALSLGQVSTKYQSRYRPKNHQIIPTIKYRPSVKCRPFTGYRTLLSAAPRLIAQYGQYYHRLVPGGNVFSHVCRPYTGCRPLSGAAPWARVAPEVFARRRHCAQCYEMVFVVCTDIVTFPRSTDVNRGQLVPRSNDAA